MAKGVNVGRLAKTILTISSLLIIGGGVGRAAQDLDIGVLSDNLTLPDPDIINAYISTNATFKNYLLTDEPPLQLIKCRVYMLQLKSSFEFYTANHTDGCEKPPPIVPLPESEYSEWERLWYFQARKWLTSWRLALALVLFNLVALSMVKGTLRKLDNSEILAPILGILFCLVFLFALVASTIWWDVTSLGHSLELPDPAKLSINPYLQSRNITLNLQRCRVWDKDMQANIRYLYDFYTGIPNDMCPQLIGTGAIYGDYTPPNKVVNLGLVFAWIFLTTLNSSGILLFLDHLAYLLVFLWELHARYRENYQVFQTKGATDSAGNSIELGES